MGDEIGDQFSDGSHVAARRQADVDLLAQAQHITAVDCARLGDVADETFHHFNIRHSLFDILRFVFFNRLPESTGT